MMESTFDCVVVGGGMAGLSAARECKNRGLKTVVLEGSDRLGGRVRTVEVGGVLAEAGAEFIHGDNSMLQLLDEAGFKYHQAEWPNYYFLGKELYLTKDPPTELSVADAAFSAIAADHRPGETLLQYFVRHGVDSRILDLADSIYANDYGESSSRIGAAEVAYEQDHWTCGEDYYRLDAPLSAAVDYLAQGLQVRYQHRVTDLGPGIVKAQTNGEEVILKTTAVVVAVSQPARCHIALPLPTTTPYLPVANGVKAFAVVDTVFWPSDLWNVVCGDSIFPEIWISRPRTTTDTRRNVYVIVGFAMGHRADRLGTLSHDTVKRSFLAQLDAIFGTDDRPHPATTACTAFTFVDWSKDSFARGAYTYPSPGAVPIRRSLATPLEEHRIYFAGEAVNSDLNPCLQGAMMSGIHAARLLLRHYDR